jgi:hypothetical protein
VARRVFPRDEELALLPGALTPSLQEDVVHLSTWMPFARAVSELRRMRGVTVSAATGRSRTEAAGAAYVAVQTAQAAAIMRDAPPAPSGPAKQLVSLDGALVHLTTKQWAEVKTLVIGAIGAPVWDATQAAWVVPTTDLSYFSRLTDLATFTQRALVETHRRGTATAGAARPRPARHGHGRRGTATAGAVATVVDGAEGNQTFIDAHRPDAVRILDFPHAAGYLGLVAEALWPDEPVRQTHWRTTQCQELKHGDPAVVVDRLRALERDRTPTPGGPPPAALAPVSTCLAYLEKREAQLQYATFQAAGYPIGSGAVESAPKAMVQARLKGAGMRWAPAQVNPMVALRNIAYTDRWAEAWPQIVSELRQQARQRVGARRQARQTALAPDGPPVVTAGPPRRAAEPAEMAAMPTWRDSGPGPVLTPTPTPEVARRPRADHPWRRGYKPRSAA